MQDAQRPDLSVVIPMYREADRIERTLRDAMRTLTVHRLTSEIVLVDDGSTDRTIDVVTPFLTENCSGNLHRVRLVRHSENRGKGAGVRTGLEAGAGRWMLMMDADNAARVAEVDALLVHAEGNVGLIAGSRAADGARVDAKATRRVTGLIFKTALRLLGLGLISDTQCGFKLYRADVAQMIVEHAVEDGFAFDIEHLRLARMAGVQTREVGIRWRHVDGSKISPISDGLKMLARAVGIRFRKYGEVSLPKPDRILELKPLPDVVARPVEERRRAGVGS